MRKLLCIYLTFVIIQESIRYSADATLLSTPDSLVVSVTRNTATTEDDQRDMPLPISTPRKSRGQNFGIDGLDSLMFTYKVCNLFSGALGCLIYGVLQPCHIVLMLKCSRFLGPLSLLLIQKQ